MSDETRIRNEICRVGGSLFDRGLTAGSSGNISVRLEDGGWLMTPTNISLGALDPARLSRAEGITRPSMSVMPFCTSEKNNRGISRLLQKP